MRDPERVFDLRTVKRNIRSGLATDEEYEQYLAALPDMSSNVRPKDEGGDEDGFEYRFFDEDDLDDYDDEYDDDEEDEDEDEDDEDLQDEGGGPELEVARPAPEVPPPAAPLAPTVPAVPISSAERSATMPEPPGAATPRLPPTAPLVAGPPPAGGEDPWAGIADLGPITPVPIPTPAAPQPAPAQSPSTDRGPDKDEGSS